MENLVHYLIGKARTPVPKLYPCPEDNRQFQLTRCEPIVP